MTDDELERRLARLEVKVDEILRLERRRAGKEDGPPPPPKFRPLSGGRWEVWAGEGTGWVEWHGPAPKESKST